MALLLLALLAIHAMLAHQAVVGSTGALPLGRYWLWVEASPEFPLTETETETEALLAACHSLCMSFLFVRTCLLMSGWQDVQRRMRHEKQAKGWQASGLRLPVAMLQVPDKVVPQRALLPDVRGPGSAAGDVHQLRTLPTNASASWRKRCSGRRWSSRKPNPANEWTRPGPGSVAQSKMERAMEATHRAKEAFEQAQQDVLQEVLQTKTDLERLM